MRAPEFWRERSGLSRALEPLALAYDFAGRWRRRLATPFRASVPVVCVGNAVAGGAGKTPVVLALGRHLRARGVAVHLLTRGYRGRLSGPLMVDPQVHGYRDVGDEALLLAEVAQTWVARDRALGAELAAASGAELVLMDDGLQNPTLIQDLAFLVVDGGYGFGNGLVMPAGPLRERLPACVARAAAAIIIGADQADAARLLEGAPLARAGLVPSGPTAEWSGRRVVAFAGIGRPTKFFDTLNEVGAEIVASFAFPDHHPYAEGELAALLARAAEAGAVPVTTSKDWVRLPPEFQPLVQALAVELAWNCPEDETLILALVEALTARA